MGLVDGVYVGVPNEKQEVERLQDKLRRLGILKPQVNVCFIADAPDCLIAILSKEDVDVLLEKLEGEQS